MAPDSNKVMFVFASSIAIYWNLVNVVWDHEDGEDFDYTRNSAIGINALIWFFFEVFKLNPAGFVGQTKLFKYH